MPQIEEHAKNILRPRKAEEVLFWVLRKIMGKSYFSAVCQCNIVYSVVHVQLCF